MKRNFLEKAGIKIILGVFLIALGAMDTNSFACSSAGCVQNNPDGSRTLLGHVPNKEIANATWISHASGSIETRIVMPLANQTELTSLLQDQYDPKSPNYHQFLTSDDFTKKFGTSSIDSKEVQDYLEKNGITMTELSRNGTVWKARGPVTAYENTFHLRINKYLSKIKNSDGTSISFYAPDAEPRVDAPIADKIVTISGLDNLSNKFRHYSQLPSPKALPQGNFGSGPGGLAPSDVVQAYNLQSVYDNLNAVPANGPGQSIGLFELDGYLSDDITAYEGQFSLPNVLLKNILVDGFDGSAHFGCQTCFSNEVTADIEMVTAFAPPGANISVYETFNEFNDFNDYVNDWIDLWQQIAQGSEKVISCSWGYNENAPWINADNQIFQQMAAEGKTVFVASGDSGDYGNGPTLMASEPADQPYATAVGISKLTINDDGSYNSETASINSGGGVSATWTIPAYQTIAASQAVKAAQVSITMRNMPDVSLNADIDLPYAVYYNGAWHAGSGSSLSAPIWASFIACVNQGLANKGKGSIGFVNPALYQIAQSSNYTKDFHDITTGANGYYNGYPPYFAEPGFDDATGLGSFNGFNLYNDLIKNVLAPPSTQPPLAPAGLKLIAVSNGKVSLSWTASTGTEYYNVKRSIVSGSSYVTIPNDPSFVITTNYTDILPTNTLATNGVTYYYVVSAVNSGGASVLSNEIKVTIPPPPPPNNLVGISGVLKTGNIQVLLTWDKDQDQSVTLYRVKRSTVSNGVINGYTTIATLNGYSNVYYADTVKNDGVIYSYVVTSVGPGGESLKTSNEIRVATAASPAGFKAVAGNAQVTLSWVASPGVTSYNLYRSTVSGGGPSGYQPVNFFPLTNTNYTDSPLNNGVAYYYVVTAINGSIESLPSEQVSATPVVPPPPPTPAGLIATAGDRKSVV